MNAWLSVIYQQKQDIPNEILALQEASQSQYATADQQRNWMTAVVGLYIQQKDYPKVVESGEQALKHSPNDPNILTSIADADNRMGKYKEAAAAVQQVLDHQSTPDEKLLAFQWNCYDKIKDEADAAKVIDKLVAFYPKPDYWQNAMASLQQKDTKDEHLQLNIYRLMSAVGVLKRPFDYGEMAEIALDLGYPGESQAVLEQALSQNVFTNPGDKDRNQHLLIGAKQRAATDQASLTNAEQAAGNATSGDQLVQVGVAYLTYGQPDKAVADISKGIAKGGLKNTDEAYLELGMAQLKAKNNAEAVRAFDKVANSGGPEYSRLGKLWALHAGAPHGGA
jgi:tetratricopeptide (TPR) repeat protein